MEKHANKKLFEWNVYFIRSLIDCTSNKNQNALMLFNGNRFRHTASSVPEDWSLKTSSVPEDDAMQMDEDWRHLQSLKTMQCKWTKTEDIFSPWRRCNANGRRLKTSSVTSVFRRLKTSSNEDWRHLQSLKTMQCKWTFTKRFVLSTLQRKCPMLR